MGDSEFLQQGSFARGWEDTKAALGGWLFWMVEVFVGGLVVIWLGAVPGLVFVFVLFLAVLIASILTAPLKQRDELRGFVKGLQEKNEKLSERSHTESLVESLSRFYSLGADLIGRRITNDSELSQLKTDMQEWVNTATMWIVQNLSKSQARLFRKASLGTLIQQFTDEYNEEHRRYQHDATQKTKYLKSLIDKYQG